MKITKDHLDRLQILVDNQIANYRERNWCDDLTSLHKHYQEKPGNWQLRFFWDTIYSVPYKDREAWFTEVYLYANDIHIETALKKVMEKYL